MQNTEKAEDVKRDMAQNTEKAEDVKRDMAQKAEARRNLSQEQTKKIIIEGYVNILKRWPDKSGMSHYSELLMSGDLLSEEFYDILINSEEYKDKFGSLMAIHI